MIPKIIHYVWVGGAPKPRRVLECIDSWKKFCPDYVFQEWDDHNIDLISNRYLKEAYFAKKWAFVSDYLRLYALDRFGGIYFDTDIQLTRKIDNFLRNSFFIGYEYNRKLVVPSTALIGAEKANPIIRGFLKEYECLKFRQDDGSYDTTTNVIRMQNYLHKNYGVMGITEDIEKIKEISKGAMIYPYFYFCKPKFMKENYAIHKFEGSWLPCISRKNLYEIDLKALRLGKLRFVAFRKNKPLNSQVILPLVKNEKILLSSLWVGKYSCALTISQ